MPDPTPHLPIRIRKPRWWPALATLALLTLIARPSAAQLATVPRLASVFPPGAKAGADVECTITGDGIDGDQRLIFSHPSITASPVPQPADRFYPTTRPAANKFLIHVGGDVAPGSYELRAVTSLGISNARSFLVGDSTEVQQKKPNADAAHATVAPVNCVVNGACTAQQSDFYRFAATKGQHLVLHCAARQIDSHAEPVLAVLSPGGDVLQEVHDAVRVDPTLDLVIPADGEYVASVHDFLYAGGPDYGYRLSISSGPWIDFIDPPFAAAGASSRHTLYGRNLPGSTPSEVKAGERALEKLEVSIPAPGAEPSPGALPAVETVLRPGEASIDTFAYRLTTPAGASNPVRLALVHGSTVDEREPNDAPEQAQPITVPAQVVARFDVRNDRDWYTFHAAKGERLWIEVISQRLGLPSDPTLLVQLVTTDAAGKTTARDVLEADDSGPGAEAAEQRVRFSTDDPAVLFTAPEEGTYRVLVRDLYGAATAGPSMFYLLGVRPAAPDFHLVAYPVSPDANNTNVPAPATVLRRGCVARVDVVALRREGFAGDVRLEVEGLPPGVTAPPVAIGPGASVGSIVFQAAPDAPDWAGTIRIVGRAKRGDDGAGEITRGAYALEMQYPANIAANNTPGPLRIGQQIPLAVRGGLSLPFTIAPAEAKPWRVVRGAKMQIPIKLTRTPNFTPTRQRDGGDGERYNGDVRLQPVGLPQTLRTQGLTIEAGASEKKLELDVDPAAAPGFASFVLRTETISLFSRGEDVAKQAAEDKQRIGAVADEVAKAAQRAVREHTKAEEAAAKAAADVATVRQKLDAVKSKQPADEAVNAATRALADAEQKGNEAQRAKATAAAADEQAKQDAKAAEEARRVADERARTTAEAAKPRDARTQLVSLPILVEVVPAPFALIPAADPAPGMQVQAGARSDLKLEIRRDPDFAEEVRFEIAMPPGTHGVTIAGKEAENRIPTGQDHAVLALTAAKDATVGDLACTLRCRYKLSGRDLTFEQPLKVSVSAAEKK